MHKVKILGTISQTFWGKNPEIFRNQRFFMQTLGSCLVKKHTYMAIKHLYHTQFKGDILEIIKKQLHNRYLSICLIFAENISQKKYLGKELRSVLLPT